MLAKAAGDGPASNPIPMSIECKYFHHCGKYVSVLGGVCDLCRVSFLSCQLEANICTDWMCLTVP